MKRRILLTILIGVPLVALVAWIGNNTHWVDTKITMPPKGEALTNPFYAVQRFAEALGARTTRERMLALPAGDSIMVLSAWHWTLSTPRRRALEQWVESGGRLVVDDSLSGGEREFARWSGIARHYPDFDDAVEPDDSAPECLTFTEESAGQPAPAPPVRRRMCDMDGMSFLHTSKSVEWALRDASRLQAARVSVGRGSVTVINAQPFRELNLFRGDHGWLFVAATDMRRGDHVVFVSEEDHPSILALVWRYGAPAVLLALALLAVALWRGSVRFGPLAAPPDSARRSLAEQIRGTGQFALRHGGGEALHAASMRALDEAAQRVVPGYLRLPIDTRVEILARLTGFNAHALAAAVHHVGVRRPNELRHAIALLEMARRQALVAQTRSHGKH